MVLIPDTNAYKKIHASHARYRLVVNGRRAGVTTACIQELSEYAREHANKVCLYVAATYAQVRLPFMWLKAELEEYIVDTDDTEKSLKLKNGTEVLCWTRYTPSSLDFAVIDGCQRISKARIDFIVGMAQHGVILADTPDVDPDKSPEDNWFYQLYLKGLKKQENWESIVLPTTMNPHVTPEKIEVTRKSLPESVFRSQYLAEFCFPEK